MQITVDVHDSEPYSWTVARGAPPPGPVDQIISYGGYVERSHSQCSDRSTARPSPLFSRSR